MELLIAAGIAAIGYRLSRDTPAPAPASTSPSTLSTSPSYVSPQPLTVTVSNARAAELRAAASIAQDAQRPLETGVVPPQPQPYFRSARTQNTNDSVKSRLHDLFTGSVLFDKSTTGTYQKKSESAPRFDPLPQPVTSSGSTGNPSCFERQMPQPSLLQNNVLPIEQIRVGRGIGVGVDAPATDGFHPMTRVMPQNVNEHRINQLETRVNVGAAPNAMRAADPKVNANRPPRVWSIDRRPPEPGKAAVNARTHRPDVDLHCTDRLMGDEYFGGAMMPGASVPADAVAPTRNRSDANPGLPQTNTTAARHGTGGFAVATFDTQRIASTQREAPDRFGTAGHVVPTGSNRPFDAARVTLRDAHAGPHDNGPAVSKDKGHMVQCTFKQLAKEAKRPIVEGYVPGVQRNVEFRRATLGNPDDWELSGMCKGKYMAISKQAQDNRVMAHASSSSMYTNMAAPGVSDNGHNKLPEVNSRQDFGLAQSVLGTNPLSVSIT